jgi:queuine tRNA-ribosyltransferase
MEPPRFEVIVTASGIRAMRERETGEIMHAGVGPCLEARTLYLEPSRLEARLCEPGDEPLVLLDVGLGAGSNAALALGRALCLRGPRRPLHVLSFDRTLSALELALATDPAAFGLDEPLPQLARVLCRRGVAEAQALRWSLCLGDLTKTLAELPPAAADIVFWDPFSPRATPQLWSVAMFGALRRACRARATVHTYSAATATRSALLLAGFAVGKGPSAGPKQRYTTQAALALSDLAQPLEGSWLRGLRSHGQGLPEDAPSDALARLSALPQFALPAP